MFCLFFLIVLNDQSEQDPGILENIEQALGKKLKKSINSPPRASILKILRVLVFSLNCLISTPSRYKGSLTFPTKALLVKNKRTLTT